MKTIKMIDLLNKIAKDELPNGTEIRATKGLKYQWFKFYRHQNFFNDKQISKIIAIGIGLNDEVEIIEEERKVEQRFTGCEWFADSKEVMSMDYLPERLKEETK